MISPELFSLCLQINDARLFTGERLYAIQYVVS